MDVLNGRHFCLDWHDSIENTYKSISKEQTKIVDTKCWFCSTISTENYLSIANTPERYKKYTKCHEISLFRQLTTLSIFYVAYLWLCLFHVISLLSTLIPLRVHRIYRQQVLPSQNHHQDLFFSKLHSMKWDNLVVSRTLRILHHIEMEHVLQFLI